MRLTWEEVSDQSINQVSTLYKRLVKKIEARIIFQMAVLTKM